MKSSELATKVGKLGRGKYDNEPPGKSGVPDPSSHFGGDELGHGVTKKDDGPSESPTLSPTLSVSTIDNSTSSLSLRLNCSYIMSLSYNTANSITNFVSDSIANTCSKLKWKFTWW